MAREETLSEVKAERDDLKATVEAQDANYHRLVAELTTLREDNAKMVRAAGMHQTIRAERDEAVAAFEAECKRAEDHYAWYVKAGAERDEAVAALRARHCGCAWCCASTPPEQRGEAHKRTCQPRLSTPKEPEWGPAGPTPYNGTVGD